MSTSLSHTMHQTYMLHIKSVNILKRVTRRKFFFEQKQIIKANQTECNIKDEYYNEHNLEVFTFTLNNFT